MSSIYSPTASRSQYAQYVLSYELAHLLDGHGWMNDAHHLDELLLAHALGHRFFVGIASATVIGSNTEIGLDLSIMLVIRAWLVRLLEDADGPADAVVSALPLHFY